MSECEIDRMIDHGVIHDSFSSDGESFILRWKKSLKKHCFP